MKLQIREYNSKTDTKEVFSLWQKEVGSLWPLDLATFCQIITHGDHFVTIDNNRIVSFIATQTNQDNASILVLLGSDQKLLDYAVKYLRDSQVKQVQLGNGGISYFWPGIPTNLPKLLKFFKANGWKFTEDSFDLIGNLKNYQQPIKTGIFSIRTANPKNINNILSFEKENFPQWYLAYQHKADLKDLRDIFYAEDNKEIIGTVFIFSAQSRSATENQIWKKLLGIDMGGICCLGVKEDMRRNGVGLALAAYATKKLQTRNAGKAFIGYTWLVNWYGKLGYKIWQQYKMSWRKI